MSDLAPDDDGDEQRLLELQEIAKLVTAAFSRRGLSAQLGIGALGYTLADMISREYDPTERDSLLQQFDSMVRAFLAYFDANPLDQEDGRSSSSPPAD